MELAPALAHVKKRWPGVTGPSMCELLSDRNSFGVFTHFGRVFLPVMVENRSFGRVLMIGDGLIISEVNGESIVTASGLQSLNQQDTFPVDSIVCAQHAIFFHGKPHFL